MVEVPGEKKPLPVQAPEALKAESLVVDIPGDVQDLDVGQEVKPVTDQPTPQELGFTEVDVPTGEEGELPFGWEEVDAPGAEAEGLLEGGIREGMEGINEFMLGGALEPGDRADGILNRVGDHFLGLDVDDPLPWWRAGTQVTGSIGGAIAGAKGGFVMGGILSAAFPPAAVVAVPVATAIGTVGGGIVGALAGSIAPEVFIEGGELVSLFDEGTREATGLSNEELYIYVQNEALLEIASLSVLSAARVAVIRPAAQLFTGTSGANMLEATRLAAKGYMLMTVQIGAGKLARGYVSVMGRMPLMGGGGLGGVMTKRALKQEEQIQKVVEGIPSRLGPLSSWHNLGDEFWDKGQAGLKVFADRMGRSFEDAFKRSADAGVTVQPSSQVDQALRELQGISAQTQKFVREHTVEVTEGVPLVLREFYEGEAGKAVKPYIEFVRREILPNQVRRDGQLTGELTSQTHLVMDDVLTKIDQEIASIDPASQRFAYSMFVRLREAIRFDMVTNASGDKGNAIGKELAALDLEWSQTMQDVFQSSIAQHLGTVSTKGIRGRGGAEIQSTRVKVSKIAKNIVRDLQDPKEVDDLIALVGPDTMKHAGAQYINDAINAGFKTVPDGSLGQWNPETFIKRLGLLEKGGGQREVTKAILEKTKAEISIEDLDDIANVLRILNSVEIPKVSTYLARRGGIGGAKTVLNAVAPGMGAVITAGAAGGVASGAGMVSLMGVATFIGGSQFIFRKLITDQKAAQLFKTVVDQEAAMVVRANAYWQLVGNVITNTAHEVMSAGSAIAGEVKTRASLLPGQEAANESATLADYDDAVDAWHEQMKVEMESRGTMPQEEIDAFFVRPNPPKRPKKKGKVR